MSRFLKFSLIGCGGLIALVVFIVIVVALVGGGGGEVAEDGGGGGDQGAGEQQGPKGKIGQTVKVGNVAWQVTTARQATELKAPYTKKKKGDFVIVDFLFTNNGDEAVTLDSGSLALLDSEGRKFEADPDAFEYIDPDKDIFLEQVNPGVEEEGEVIFTVAPDAKDFTLQAGDTDMFSDKNGYIDLGF